MRLECLLKQPAGRGLGRQHNSTPRTSAKCPASKAVALPFKLHASALIPLSLPILMNVLKRPLYVFSPPLFPTLLALCPHPTMPSLSLITLCLLGSDSTYPSTNPTTAPAPTPTPPGRADPSVQKALVSDSKPLAKVMALLILSPCLFSRVVRWDPDLARESQSCRW